MAEKTLVSLNASGEKVVLLARAGQDLTKYGLRYSHLGFAYQTTDAKGDPTWHVVHKLNECGSAVSAIYKQGLGEFFLDDLWRPEAVWIAPTPDVQTRLLRLLQDPLLATGIHHKPYSTVSYVWGQKYQQSNQWAIETLAVAMEPTVLVGKPGNPDIAASRARAQAWLQFKGYEPSVITLGPLTRLGGRITAANIAFDDHPNEKRFADRIETVTVDSILQWLRKSQLVTSDKPVVLGLNP